MPGIAGLITKMPPELAEHQLAEMVKSLRHEPFYTSGTWTDPAAGVYVGWTAHEGSFSDGMPVHDERTDVVLVFSGEEYSASALAGQREATGHGGRSCCASYIARAYDEDPLFPRSLNGRFHGLVSDRRTGTTVLFNDRYGMHRLYYHESHDAFYFAVEAKALLAVRPALRTLDFRGLGEYVSCGCVLENRTLFERIYVMPPASAWRFRAGSLGGKSTYFIPSEWEQQQPDEPEAFHENVRAAFSGALPRCLEGRQRIGMSLTGGLDTRLVMAWQNFPPGSLPCYTYTGPFRECRDVLVARRVARVCRQPHEVIPLGSDFLSQFPWYAERSMYLSDACVNVARAPDLYLSEKARAIAPVRMTGLYGDELFRPAVRAFKPVTPSAGLYAPEFLPFVDGGRETYREILKGHPTSFSAFRQAPWHHHGILALEQSQLTVRTPFLDNDFVRTVFRAPESVAANNDLRVRLIGDGSIPLQRIRTDRGFAGSGAGVRSVAAQVFHEFTFKAEYAYDYGMPQWLVAVDRLLSPFRVERLFLGRHKPYHYRVWYRDVLRDYVQDVLLDPRTLARPYVVREGVEKVVCSHLRGVQNHTTALHQLLSLELLNRLFIEGC